MQASLAFLALALSALPGGGISAAGPAPANLLALHAPIGIEGESNFTAANGVSGGTGSAEDPFVIQNLEISVEDGWAGILVYNTTSHLLVRNVAIDSGTFEPGTASTIGIYLILANNVTIEDVRVSGSGAAFYGEGLLDLTVSRMSASSREGVWVYSSDRVTIRDTTLGGGNASSLYLSSTTNATLANVSLEAGFLDIIGTEPEHYSTHTIASDVTVFGKPVQYSKDCSGVLAPSRNLGQLIAVGCHDVVVHDTTIEGAHTVLEFAYVKGLALEGNTFRNASAGVSVFRSSGIEIRSNTFEASASAGLVVFDSQLVSISGNRMSFAETAGIYLSNVSDFSVSGNVLDGALTTSIAVDRSRAGVIGGNVVNNASSAAVEIARSSQLLVTANTVADAQGFGMRLSGLSDSRVEANRVFRAMGVSLQLSGSDAVAVVGNELESGGNGIDLDQISGGALLDNRVVGHAYVGLRLGSLVGFSIDRNSFEANAGGVVFRAGYRYDPSSLEIGPDNRVDGQPLMYRSGCNGETIEPVRPYILIIANCTDIKVTNGTFDGAESRLWLYDVAGGEISGLIFNGTSAPALRIEKSRNITVMNSVFHNQTATAAALVRSQNLTFLGNQVDTARGEGLLLDDCNNCTISNNRVVAHNDTAVEVSFSDDVVVEGNEIEASVRGISTFYAERMRVERNTITGSLLYGIAGATSYHMAIVNNRIGSSPGTAIYLHFGWYSNVTGNSLNGNKGGLEISSGWNISVWLNDFSSNSNHSIVLTDSSGIYVFSNNFDRVTGSISMDSSWARFHQGWVTGGNYWAGHPIHDQCGGSDQAGGCGPPDGFDDGSFFVTNDWRVWYSLADPAVDSDHDGLADSWEKKYGLDPANATDAAGDPDGDGLSNLQEFVKGGSPVAADTDGDLLADGADSLVWWQSEEYLDRQSVKIMGLVVAGMAGGMAALLVGVSRAVRKAAK